MQVFRDLSWRERIFMLALVAPLLLAGTLILMDRIYEFVRADHACGVTCRVRAQEVERIFRTHEDDATSCLAEFHECVRLSGE